MAEQFPPLFQTTSYTHHLDVRFWNVSKLLNISFTPLLGCNYYKILKVYNLNYFTICIMEVNREIFAYRFAIEIIQIKATPLSAYQVCFILTQQELYRTMLITLQI